MIFDKDAVEGWFEMADSRLFLSHLSFYTFLFPPGGTSASMVGLQKKKLDGHSIVVLSRGVCHYP